MVQIEDSIQEFRITYYRGTTFDKSVTIYTDTDCKVPFNYTYHEGFVDFKGHPDWGNIEIGFNSDDNSLYLSNLGVVRLFRQAPKISIQVGVYEGVLVIIDGVGKRTPHAKFILEVKENTSKNFS